MRITTQSLHFDADQKLLFFIEKRLQKLSHFHDRILEAHVILKLENTGQVQDKVVEIKINLPHGNLIAKDTSKTFEKSVDEVVESLTRQLIKYKEKINVRN